MRMTKNTVTIPYNNIQPFKTVIMKTMLQKKKFF